MPKPHSRLRYQISSYFVSRLLCLKPKEAVVVSRQLAYYSHMPLHQSLWILHCRISKVTGTGITDCPTAHGPAKPVSSSSTAWPSPKQPRAFQALLTHDGTKKQLSLRTSFICNFRMIYCFYFYILSGQERVK